MLNEIVALANAVAMPNVMAKTVKRLFIGICLKYGVSEQKGVKTKEKIINCKNDNSIKPDKFDNLYGINKRKKENM